MAWVNVKTKFDKIESFHSINKHNNYKRDNEIIDIFKTRKEALLFSKDSNNIDKKINDSRFYVPFSSKLSSRIENHIKIVKTKLCIIYFNEELKGSHKEYVLKNSIPCLCLKESNSEKNRLMWRKQKIEKFISNTSKTKVFIPSLSQLEIIKLKNIDNISPEEIAYLTTKEKMKETSIWKFYELSILLSNNFYSVNIENTVNLGICHLMNLESTKEDIIDIFDESGFSIKI